VRRERDEQEARWAKYKRTASQPHAMLTQACACMTRPLQPGARHRPLFDDLMIDF